MTYSDKQIPLYYHLLVLVFLIKPNFILRNRSGTKIELQLTSISLPAMCEKSIQSKTTLNINRVNFNQ
jgi:hypothetical protein